jgi:hypothetical protein
MKRALGSCSLCSFHVKDKPLRVTNSESCFLISGGELCGPHVHYLLPCDFLSSSAASRDPGRAASASRGSWTTRCQAAWEMPDESIQPPTAALSLSKTMTDPIFLT